MYSTLRKLILWTILAAIVVAIVLKIRKKKMENTKQELAYAGGGSTPSGNNTVINPAPVQPVTGGWISGKFGESRPGHIHSGVDVAVVKGTPVLSPWDGKVTKKWNDIVYGGGLSLLIKHDNGYTTGYCHLSSYPANIAVGTRVYRGDVVAFSGNTGRSTGPHLHFSLRTPNDLKVDPCKYGFDFK